jgi:hypothetical protein
VPHRDVHLVASTDATGRQARNRSSESPGGSRSHEGERMDSVGQRRHAQATALPRSRRCHISRFRMAGDASTCVDLWRARPPARHRIPRWIRDVVFDLRAWVGRADRSAHHHEPQRWHLAGRRTTRWTSAGRRASEGRARRGSPGMATVAGGTWYRGCDRTRHRLPA